MVWGGYTTTQSRILKNALSNLLNLTDTSRRGSHLGARVAAFLKLDKVSPFLVKKGYMRVTALGHSSQVTFLSDLLNIFIKIRQ